MAQDTTNQARRLEACHQYPIEEQPDCRLRMSFHSPEYYEARKTIAQAKVDEDASWTYLSIAVLLWPAYMLVRWIITGQSRKVEENAR
jgi:hypothetical protein